MNARFGMLGSHTRRKSGRSLFGAERNVRSKKRLAQRVIRLG
jgi:hypothetical protein